MSVSNNSKIADNMDKEADDEVRNKLYGVRNAVIIPCKKCRNPAATIELIPQVSSKDKKTILRVKGFIGEITTCLLGSKDLSDESLDQVQKLAKSNLKELHQLDQDIFGFICRECGVAYCRNCWSNMIERFDGVFFDDIRATCPKGHEQMVQD